MFLNNSIEWIMGIYLDYSATTPTRREVRQLMGQILSESWGNPSSIHSWGERSALILEQGRMAVAALVGSSPEEIVFTGSGTAANHLAILGVARKYAKPGHMIISGVEHSAVSAPVAWLESQGWRVTRLGVDASGRVNPQDLSQALQPDTALVSVIYGQNEVGTIQPIGELGLICRSWGVLFHTDAVQVVGRLPVDVQQLPIDLLSLSGHKFYGPQGVGALFVRSGVELAPLLWGGGQERGLYSGTQPVASIGGLGLAAQLAEQELSTEVKRLQDLREKLKNGLESFGVLIFTGHQTERLPHHLSFCHPQMGGREIVRKLNHFGIAISAGAACSSGKILPSPVLLAMGFTDREALGGFRLSLGKDTTEADIDHVIDVFRSVLQN